MTRKKTAPRAASSPELRAPRGFRLRSWQYPVGTARHGLVCNRCGYCADPPKPEAVGQADLDVAGAAHMCPRPRYAWDFWRTKAAERGVDPEVAEVGRAVFREAYQHQWSGTLQDECGWSDDGDAMIRLALSKPRQALERWSHLLVTDGGRYASSRDRDRELLS